MPGQMNHPTAFPKVNALLHELLSAVKSILGDNFVGMYLYGSLASGDFAPEKSDIDFIVVTAAELTEESVTVLEAMHGRLAAGDSPWARELEGSYIPQPALRRYDPANACHLHIDRGETLGMEQHDSDWVIQRHILRECGVAVAGPAADTLIDPVSGDELKQAVLAILLGWWAHQLQDPIILQKPAYRAYAILTMCRALYTFRHGTIVSKPVASKWALETLDERWQALIKQGLAWPEDSQVDNLNETLEFIRYTCERGQKLAMIENGNLLSKEFAQTETHQ